jgi:Fe-S cluster assembly protein SufB
MEEPDWAHVSYQKPNFQEIIYYAAPKPKKQYESLNEVDPEILKTFEKLGVPINEQKALVGVAVDVVMDSVSVATTFKEKLGDLGIIFCSFSEAVKNHPDLVKKYVGSVVPQADNFYSALNSAVFFRRFFLLHSKRSKMSNGIVDLL